MATVGLTVKPGQGGYSKTSGLTGAGPISDEDISNNPQEKPLNNNYNIAAFPSVGSNPLNKYVTYNCLFTLSCLDKSLQNSGKFNKSNIKNIIARSQGDWGKGNNRVSTIFGQYDYFIDDVIIVSMPAVSSKTGEAFATKITFKVTEPYSMGLFLDAMLEGAQQGGYGNFREAPYLLMIEFAGYTDDTKPHAPDPSLTRYIPIKFIDVKLKVTSSGSTYDCEVVPYNELAFRDPTSNTKVAVNLQGDTVENLLWKGPKSLNQALADFYKTLIKDKELSSTDQMIITFPKDFTDPNDSGNEISNSKVFLDFDSNGTVRFPNQNDIFDDAKQFYKNSSVTITKEKVFQFKQDYKIQNIIKDIIMRSDYITKQLTKSAVKLNKKGMINWFRVETQIKDGDENIKTNRQNRTITYRVVPYEVHISKLLPPNAIPAGYSELRKTVNRIYDYTYTGKNTEVISVDLEFNMAFFSKVAADAGGKSGTNNDGQTPGTTRRDPIAELEAAEKRATGDPHQPSAELSGKISTADKSGSGNDDTYKVLNYREMLTNPSDLIEIKLTIRGDPYYLPSSGMGNQIKQPVGDNLMEDGSMNYQSGEVDIVLNFRTPIDLNPITGLYTFAKTVDQFSGLYQILEVESKFNQNKFTQTITGLRRRTQLIGSGESSAILGTV